MADHKAPQTQSDPWEQAASQYKASGASTGDAPSEDWKVWQQGDAPAEQINTPGEMLSATGHVLGSIGMGALKGAGDTANNLGHVLYPDWLAKHLTGAPTAEQQDAHFAPANKAEGLGKGLERVGEFFLPAGAEKMAAAKAAEFAPKLAPLARVLTGALSSGAVNKAQGGTFTGGALTGGVTGAAAEGARAVAPSVMKSALRVGSEGLEYDRNTGKSVLDHTTGIRPGTIAKQAQAKVSDWSHELDQKAANSPDADLTPIWQSQQAREALANYRNSPTEQKLLQRINIPLRYEVQNGSADLTKPLAANIAPHRLRAIKQGVGSEIANFAPQNQAAGAAYKKQLYGDIDKEFNRVVPGSAELDQQMSSLIPAIRAGQKVETSAPMSSRVLHRVAAHTGAMAGSVGGAFTGYQHGGVPGAVAGGLAGLIVPEVAVSPTTQALAARVMNSPASGRVARAVVTPAVRGTLDWIRKQNTGTGGTQP